MEPVLKPSGVRAIPPRVARPNPARFILMPATRAGGLEPLAAAEGTRQSERLAVLTALSLAVVTSALSFGFIVGGSADVASASGRTIVEVWPIAAGSTRSDDPPAMGGSSSLGRRSGVLRASPLSPLPSTSIARHSLDVPPPPRTPSSPRASSLATAPKPPQPAADVLKQDEPAAAQHAAMPTASRRIRVRRKDGQVVVARVHGGEGHDLHVVLPDGQLGIPDRPVYTDAPFVAAMVEEMERDLLAKGPYSGFKSLRLPHYLIVYQSSDEFARQSGEVLERLYKGLTDAFRKFDVPVHDAEFPLVAVIFPTEAAFRAFKAVDPEIQAYYEIYSNRILFYETSSHDAQAPEVAALRRPQTVAHEGTHQILQNIGIQPRLAPWPLWLVEGLAEYCSTPVTSKKGITTWAGLGMVNAYHIATIRDLGDPLSGQVAGSTPPEHIGRKPGMPLVEYLVTKADLSPTDYALSWAMTHHLARRRVADFITYLRAMSALPPLSKRTPANQLAAFGRAFGTDLGRLDAEINTHLGKLKVTNQLPYYSVMSQQRVGGGLLRRAAIVSQSPSMIRQWLETISASGDPPAWEAYPFPNRTPALAAAAAWVGSR